MIRRPPRSTQSRSSAASDVYKRQITHNDSLDARVYSQYPAYMENATLGFGTRVDIWLTLNQARIPKIERADSVNTMPAKHADEIIE